jgi:hypothetical protein
MAHAEDPQHSQEEGDCAKSDADTLPELQAEGFSCRQTIIGDFSTLDFGHDPTHQEKQQEGASGPTNFASGAELDPGWDGGAGESYEDEAEADADSCEKGEKQQQTPSGAQAVGLEKEGF